MAIVAGIAVRLFSSPEDLVAEEAVASAEVAEAALEASVVVGLEAVEPAGIGSMEDGQRIL